MTSDFQGGHWGSISEDLQQTHPQHIKRERDPETLLSATHPALVYLSQISVLQLADLRPGRLRRLSIWASLPSVMVMVMMVIVIVMMHAVLHDNGVSGFGFSLSVCPLDSSCSGYRGPSAVLSA